MRGAARQNRVGRGPRASLGGALWAGLLGAASCGWAGDYHTGVTGLHCSDCHVMHASQRGISFGGGLLSPPGFPWLMRAATVNELCLTCHDGGTGASQTAPDVAGPASYETGAVRRIAGAFQGAMGALTANGHDMGVPDQVAPGGSWSSLTGLTCVNCHDPHGNAYYRNLVPRPGNASSDRLVTDIAQAELAPTSTHYSVANVRYTGPNGLGPWCQGCHTDFHGSPGDPRMGGVGGGDAPGSDAYWFRHPTVGVTMAQAVANRHADADYWFTGARSRVPVVSPTDTIPSGDNAVFCGSCHKAHGSPRRAGLIWDDPTTMSLEDGSAASETCQTCHYQ